MSTPTTTTKTIGGRQITHTTWTVGDHTLTRTRIEQEGASDGYWTTSRTNTDAPHVGEDTAHWHDDTAPITYSVNWSAWGDCTPEEAFEYATRLMEAVTAARVFAAIRAEHQ